MLQGWANLDRHLADDHGVPVEALDAADTDELRRMHAAAHGPHARPDHDHG